MRSRTSFFNKTVFKKNLTRFAPVWGAYALGLLVWLGVNYADSLSGEFGQKIRFAYRFGRQWAQNASLLNLFYAPGVAMLLFGDLFNSRMCNALHAMPLRREGWFVTNFLSGLFFSAAPTTLMALVAVPMVGASLYVDGWQLAFLWLAQVNLQFVCFFGIAVFCMMCTGNRFTMAAGYGLVNFGAYIVYALVDTVYTPMLYGVITPTRLASFLTPMEHMQQYEFVKMEYPQNITDEFGELLPNLAPVFTLTEHWGRLFALAAVGLVFAALAVALYRKRHLECAGDAVAFPILRPVFHVLCALFCMVVAQYSMYIFFGRRGVDYLMLALGLTAGWFVGKMLLERSTRVFRKENLPGLGLLALAVAASMVLTHFDVLNITGRIPEEGEVQSVSFSSTHTAWEVLEEEDLEAVLRLHQLAIEEPIEEEEGLYVTLDSGERALYHSLTAAQLAGVPDDPAAYAKVAGVEMDYTLKNGSHLRRVYNIWADGEAGDLARRLLSRWETVSRSNSVYITPEGEEYDPLGRVLSNFRGMYISGYERSPDSFFRDVETARSFLEAVKADCDAGLMAQDSRFHRGVFRETVYDEYGESYPEERSNLYVILEGYQTSWEVQVYTDSVNTLNWMEQYGLLEPFQIDPNEMNRG